VKRSKLNYWVDMFIGATLVTSAVSGLVFLLPAGNASALGVSYRTWSTVHTWSSLAMIGGAGMHLLLHWKWLVTMTNRMIMPLRDAQVDGAGANASGMTRRRFLRLGLGAAAATVAAAYAIAAGSGAAEGTGAASVPADGSSDGQTGTGAATDPPEKDRASSAAAQESAPSEETSSPSSPEKAEAGAADAAPEPEASSEEQPQSTAAGEGAESDSDLAEDVQADSSPAETEEPAQQEELGVACLFGLVNDPYPGRCRRYTDSNEDGICDCSVLGSGSVQPRV